MYLCLRKNRRAIEARTTRTGDNEGRGLDYLAVWFAAYKPKKWWFGIADMMRRLALTSLLMIFASLGPGFQVESSYA